MHQPAVQQCLLYDANVRRAAASCAEVDVLGGQRQRSWSFSRGSSALSSKARQLIEREEATRVQAFQAALLEHMLEQPPRFRLSAGLSGTPPPGIPGPLEAQRARGGHAAARHGRPSRWGLARPLPLHALRRATHSACLRVSGQSRPIQQDRGHSCRWCLSPSMQHLSVTIAATVVFTAAGSSLQSDRTTGGRQTSQGRERECPISPTVE